MCSQLTRRSNKSPCLSTASFLPLLSLLFLLLSPLPLCPSAPFYPSVLPLPLSSSVLSLSMLLSSPSPSLCFCPPSPSLSHLSNSFFKLWGCVGGIVCLLINHCLRAGQSNTAICRSSYCHLCVFLCACMRARAFPAPVTIHFLRSMSVHAHVPSWMYGTHMLMYVLQRSGCVFWRVRCSLSC